MDIRKIKKLIELLEESGLAEIEITEGEEKVRISRQAPAPTMMMAGHPMQHVSLGAAPAAEPAAAPVAAEPKGHALKSPMVGTFYSAPEPGAKPYVAVGSRVAKGQILCIIEAMKIMNEIESEFSGVVTEISVQDAHPVEYGQVLFRIDPNG